MRRPDHRGPLPEELARLGAYLEGAAAAQLARRTHLRRAVVRWTGTVLAAVPMALVAATVDVAPSARPVAELARSQGVTPSPSLRAEFRLDRVPDEVDAAGGRPCVMVPDCRAVAVAVPYP